MSDVSDAGCPVSCHNTTQGLPQQAAETVHRTGCALGLDTKPGLTVFTLGALLSRETEENMLKAR